VLRVREQPRGLQVEALADAALRGVGSLLRQQDEGKRGVQVKRELESEAAAFCGPPLSVG
jgi:hypothetical protein